MSRRQNNPGFSQPPRTRLARLQSDSLAADPAGFGVSRAVPPGGNSARPDAGDDELVDFSYSSPGALPGTLRIPPDALPTELFLISYSPEAVQAVAIDHPDECRTVGQTPGVNWIDARGLGTEARLVQMSETLGFHPLMLEDVVNVPHRPKIDFYDDKILIVMQMVRPQPTGSGVASEQVSFVLGQNFLATFQEEPEWDSFDPVRDRIRRGTGSIRRQGADYLAYALLDTIVDSFFPVLEVIGETLEELEEEVVDNPTSHTIEKIHRMRRGLMKLRRYIWPQRSVINSLIRDSDELISQEVRVYLQDVYDHIVQVVDIIENYREIASSLMDVYLSSINNRMNEVMKLLTVISSIFIPLTFIAGVYGMNFAPDTSPFNMPELEWYWGYIVCLSVMAIIATAQIYLFWKRGWFDNFSATKR
ncbi:magnesium/cobalt transporter CorA [Nodosilinea sp. E11]|uniref:magnesium/cobalt transporter CorA n=1 Tax=Nodosilinea sp. E11 TaxID=3037479 RepID=UPI0029353303|nr:magnesium/cobalt transporter CorA [Nodosilinea sp. E11]WOD40929.1 magnesium/cobalt transporter CorA [Nodosilinea sp. E11]